MKILILLFLFSLVAEPGLHFRDSLLSSTPDTSGDDEGEAESEEEVA